MPSKSKATVSKSAPEKRDKQKSSTVSVESTVSLLDRSGAIGLEELEAAMRNLGLEQTRDELDKIIDEVGPERIVTGYGSIDFCLPSHFFMFYRRADSARVR